jgi:hypothetical protein
MHQKQFMKSSFNLPLVAALAIILIPLLRVAGAASYITTPVSDAFVTTGATGNLSGNNFGLAGSLAVAAGGLPQGEFQSVLQFDLSGARNSFDAQFGAGLWGIQSVTLKLTSSPHGNPIFNDIAAGQFNVSLMQNNSWLEGTGTGGVPTTDGISYSSLQSIYINNTLDQSLGAFSFPGGSSGPNNYSLGLSSGLGADVLAGTLLSLRLDAGDDHVSYLFSSRNAGVAVQPNLTIVAVPEPGTMAIWLLGLATVAIWNVSRRTTARMNSPC